MTHHVDPGAVHGVPPCHIVDRAKREADVSFSAAERERLVTRVMATSLAMLLGRPTEQRVDGAHTLLRYHYTPMPPGAKNGLIDMLFTFETAHGQLLRLQGRSPVGNLSFNFESPPASAPGKTPPPL